jgi:hypothetical protein
MTALRPRTRIARCLLASDAISSGGGSDPIRTSTPSLLDVGLLAGSSSVAPDEGERRPGLSNPSQCGTARWPWSTDRTLSRAALPVIKQRGHATVVAPIGVDQQPVGKLIDQSCIRGSSGILELAPTVSECAASRAARDQSAVSTGVGCARGEERNQLRHGDCALLWPGDGK